MLLKNFKKLRSIFNGYIVGPQFAWRNLVNTNNKYIRLADARGIKYIHVGYHRTGATFLQEEVFPRYQSSEKIFSDDTLCGRLFENGLDAVEYVYKSHPKAKILIVIRSQPSIINSAYKNYIKKGGVWNFQKYTNEILSRKKYDFYPLVKKYINYFGKKNCKVMIFEDLIQSPKDYVKTVLKFIGEKKILEHDYSVKKPAPSNLFNELFRYINIFAKILSLLGFDSLYQKILGKTKEVPSLRFKNFCYRWGISVDDRVFRKLGIGGRYSYGFKNALPEIKATYALNNKKLSKLIGKDLALYKYPIN